MIWCDWSIELASELQDVQDDTAGQSPGQPITLYSQNGVKATAMQRLNAINEARLWAVTKVVDVWGIKNVSAVIGGNIGTHFLDLTKAGGDDAPDDMVQPLSLWGGEGNQIRYYLIHPQYPKVKYFDNDSYIGATDVRVRYIKGKFDALDAVVAEAAQIELTYVYYDIIKLAGILDVHENYRFHSAIKAYARYLLWSRSGNTERALNSANEAKQLLIGVKDDTAK